MGYALTMFGVLLIMSVVMVTAANYGIAKDSQIAPLKAKNVYAEREMGKVQTGITIVNTCLSGGYRYVDPTSPAGQYGPYTLNITVRNNGSIVLNPKNSTMFYNSSYVPFNVTTGEVWTPLINSTILVQNIYIYSSDANYPLRLMMATSNGVTTIAPTTPTNFSGRNYGNTTFEFKWNSSQDDKGISYYLIYKFEGSAQDTCPKTPDDIFWVAGNQTSMTASIPCPQPCKTKYLYMVAVDVDGNMAIPSKTIKCPGQSNNPCEGGI